MRPSDEKLAAALREVGLVELAQRAGDGEFNDFFGEHATPKIALVLELRSNGYDSEQVKALVERVKDGEFESGRDEAEEWAATPEGRALREFLSGS